MESPPKLEGVSQRNSKNFKEISSLLKDVYFFFRSVGLTSPSELYPIGILAHLLRMVNLNTMRSSELIGCTIHCLNDTMTRGWMYMFSRWWQLKYVSFSPLGEDSSILTSIFFDWVLQPPASCVSCVPCRSFYFLLFCFRALAFRVCSEGCFDAWFKPINL